MIGRGKVILLLVYQVDSLRRRVFDVLVNLFKPGVPFMGHIGKQNSPICDAAERGVPSGAILFA